MSVDDGHIGQQDEAGRFALAVGGKPNGIKREKEEENVPVAEELSFP